MTIGDEEVFRPVICVKRVQDFEEGLELMNRNRFANGSVIFTQSGYYSREFARRTHGGMVGINVGIPVPVGLFPFTGHKDSFFGDLHISARTASASTQRPRPSPASGLTRKRSRRPASIRGTDRSAAKNRQRRRGNPHKPAG